jgi:UDP-GlcNAc:undecaprenyl-phosphate GlcNAc-1-phosphate transferase
MILATTLFLSLFITLALVPIFRGLALRANIVDVPNERKVHKNPMPKIGGLAMALGFIIPILLWLPLDRFVAATLAGAAILVIEGFVDDIYILGYKPKFLAQIAAALVVILCGGVEITRLGTLLPDGFTLPAVFSLPLTLLVIVGITNAVNLADGLDGLAGGIVLVSFLCIGIIAYKIGDNTVLIMSLAMLGALFGFLSFNTYPASVFMGDAGSQFLGFMSVVLSIKLTQGSATLSHVLPLLIIGLPVIDTLVVMSERIREGRSPFVADNNHFHHKLLGMGLYHTEAVFIIYVVQSVFVLSAYLFRFHSDWFVVALYLSLMAFIIVFTHNTSLSGFRFKRSEFIDQAIKGRLKFLKNRSALLSVCTHVLHVLLPALLLVNCLFVKDMPRYASLVSLALAPVIVACWVKGAGVVKNMVRTVLYFLIPFVIYFGQEQSATWYGLDLEKAYLAAYALCIVTAVAMVRLDRRRNNFRGNPMDFLIIVIAVCVSPLLSAIMDIQKTRMFLVQILIFFYTYEIMLNERRPVRNVVIATTVGALLIISLKGVLP